MEAVKKSMKNEKKKTAMTPKKVEGGGLYLLKDPLQKNRVFGFKHVLVSFYHDAGHMEIMI